MAAETAWRPALGNKCTLLVRPVSARGLKSVARFGRGQHPYVRVTLEPWGVVAESAPLRNGDVDPVWDKDELLEFDFPGWTGEAREPGLRIEVWNRRLSTAIGKDGIIGEGYELLSEIFQDLARGGPVSRKVLLKEQGALQLVLSAVPSPEEEEELRLRRLAEDASQRVLDIPELTRKVTEMFRNASVNLLNGKPFDSAFAIYDPRRTGLVTRREFVRTLRGLEFRLTVQELTVLMGMLDMAGDGKKVAYTSLSKLVAGFEAEAKEARALTASSPTLDGALSWGDGSRKQLQEILLTAELHGMTATEFFRHFDKEGSGRISKNDFQAGLEQLGIHLSIKDLVLLMQELDRNHDGWISLDEFETFAEHEHARAATNAANEEEHGASDLSPSSSSSSSSYSRYRKAKSRRRKRLEVGAEVYARPSADEKPARGQVVELGPEKTCSVRFHSGAVRVGVPQREVKVKRKKERRHQQEERRGRSHRDEPDEEAKSPEASEGALLEKVHTELEKTKTTLELCRERMRSLEERCARAEAKSHMIVSRAMRQAEIKERNRMEDHFAVAICERIEADYGDDMKQLGLDDKTELRKTAHLAFASILEEKLRKSNDKIRAQKREIAALQRRAEASARHSAALEAFVRARRDIFSPRLDTLGVRVSHLVRALICKTVARGCESSRGLFDAVVARRRAREGAREGDGSDSGGGGGGEGGDNDKDGPHNAAQVVSLQELQSALFPLPVTAEDMEQMEREFVRGGISLAFANAGPVAGGNNNSGGDENDPQVWFSVEPLAEGLDRCKEWDLADLMDRGPADDTIPTVDPATGAPDTLLVLASVAGGLPGELGAFQWFGDSFELAQERADTALTLSELNDELIHRHLPGFADQADLEVSLAWIAEHCPVHMSERLDAVWRDRARVDVEAFAMAINNIADGILEHKVAEERDNALRYPFQTVASLDEGESKQASGGSALPPPERLLSKFSATENSMMWAPLRNFHSVPVDCLRLNSSCTRAEHNTTKARSVMAFVEGAIERDGRNAVVLRLEAAPTASGTWALCVTSGPPGNKPARGAAVYTHSGEARLEGLASIEQHALLTELLQESPLLESRPMLTQHKLSEIRAKCRSDEHALERIYGRFAPSRLLLEVISDATAEVEARMASMEGARDPAPKAFLWKSREVEAQLRINHGAGVRKFMHRDHWALSDLFGEMCSATELRKETPCVQHSQMLQAAGNVYRAFKDLMDQDSWKSLMEPLRQDGRTLLDVDGFITLLHDLEARIVQHFALDEGSLAAFKAEMARLSGKRRQGQNLHHAAVGFRDSLAAVVDDEAGKVTFLVNGVFQAQLAPKCSRPWRFAWFTNRASAASILSRLPSRQPTLRLTSSSRAAISKQQKKYKK